VPQIQELEQNGEQKESVQRRKIKSRYLTIATTTNLRNARKLDLLWITTGFQGVAD